MFRQSLFIVRTTENQECASALSSSIHGTRGSCHTENQVSFSSSSQLFKFCDDSVEVSFQIYPGESVEFSWKGKKNLLTMQHYPPDTSYGFHVLPAIIRYKSLEKDLFETEYLTESVVLNRPIPDLSMPYNVITLVKHSLYPFNPLNICDLLLGECRDGFSYRLYIERLDKEALTSSKGKFVRLEKLCLF